MTTEAERIAARMSTLADATLDLSKGRLLSSPCTCTGCPPAVHRIIAHWWQEEAFILHKPYEPCMNREGSERCCGCGNAATQEDLLCNPCREKNGISYLQIDRIEEWLAGSGQGMNLRGQVAGRRVSPTARTWSNLDGISVTVDGVTVKGEIGIIPGGAR